MKQVNIEIPLAGVHYIYVYKLGLIYPLWQIVPVFMLFCA